MMLSRSQFGMLLLGVWLTLSAMAEAVTVSARVQPSRARPNQMVSYVIEVNGGQIQSVPTLRLPLQISQQSAMSNQREIQLDTSGRQSIRQLLSWGLAASEPGEFVIPPQDVLVNGQRMKTNEVKITIEQGGVSDQPDVAEDGKIEPFLQLELGKKEIYQGEVMTLNCSLYVPRQTQLRRLGLVDIEKSDFAIARFPQQSDQTMTSVNGVGYYVLTFRSTLSSLRTGELQVGPASMEILVEVPVESANRPNMFPPGFPQGFFGVPTEPRKVVVKSQPVTLKVLPLPEEGRPKDFSGAVGDFTLSVSASPAELTVGDPLSVDLIVDGRGNFDALTAPKLLSTGGWKSYPAKRYHIEGPSDQNQIPTLERKIGYSQVWIPEAVHKELPPFEMSFFSPEKKQYVTLRTEALPLEMKPAAAVATAGEAAPGGASATAELPPASLPPQADLTDILVNLPAKPHWQMPGTALLARNPAFWLAQGVPAGLLLLASAVAVLRRRREKLETGRRHELRKAWRDFDQAGSDDASFLRQAAQLIHVAQAGEPVTDASLRDVLERYESVNFAHTPNQPLTSGERRDIHRRLGQLLRNALAKASVVLLMMGTMLAQTPDTKSAEPVSTDATYREAREELEKGRYTRAQYLAESLTKQQPPQLSSELFQLIGHARYRQKDLGRAALWYQRAELLDGRSPELRQNLRHLRDRLHFLTFETTAPWLTWSFLLTTREWLLLGTAGVWLLCLAAAWRIVSGRRQALPLWLAGIGLLLAAPSLAFAGLRPDGETRVRDLAVVTANEARAYTAATVTSGSVIDLPAGSQVRLLEKRGAWNYVEIPDPIEPLRGWVEGRVLEPLWPWDAAFLP